MDFLTKVLPDNIVKAIFNTLMHSMWQGLLLAILVGVLMVLTRSMAPARRYVVLIGLLFTFCSGVVVTFYYQIKEQVIPEHLLFKQYPVVDVMGKPLLGDSFKLNEYQTIFSFLNNYASILIFVWVLIMLVKTFRLLTDMQFIYHLRRRKIQALGPDWENKVRLLAKQLGIKQFVSIAESGIARIPMVVGHFKPLILIPLGLATALTSAEIEAILVHELAHIYRRDYLVNVLVSLVEIVFFFNPAVLWLSNLIRDERENCCDDIAVNQTGNKIGYIKALVACQEYHLTAPNYAMAFSGEKKHLSNRVKRLLATRNSALNGMEKALLAICIIIIAALTAAFTNAKKIDQLVTVATNKVVSVSESIVNGEKPSLSVHQIEPKPIVELNEKLSWNEMPDATFKVFEPSQIGNHTSVTIPNGNLETQLIKRDGVLYQINYNKNQIVSLQRNGCAVPPAEVKKYIAQIDSLQSSEQSSSRSSVKVPPLKVLTNKNHDQLQQYKYYPDSSVRNQPYPISNGSRKTGLEKQLSVNTRVDIPINIAITRPIDDSFPKMLLDAIINDGLASKVESYKLTETDLTVNGKPLAKEIFQQFKEKHLKAIKKGTTISYNIETITTITTKPAGK